MRAVHSYRVRIRLTRVTNIFPDFSIAVGGFRLALRRIGRPLQGPPPEWRPKDEILKTVEEGGRESVSAGGDGSRRQGLYLHPAC